MQYFNPVTLEPLGRLLPAGCAVEMWDVGKWWGNAVVIKSQMSEIEDGNGGIRQIAQVKCDWKDLAREYCKNWYNLEFFGLRWDANYWHRQRKNGSQKKWELAKHCTISWLKSMLSSEQSRLNFLMNFGYILMNANIFRRTRLSILYAPVALTGA